MLLKKKIIGRSRLYDILHKGWVNTCLVATVLGLGTFGIIGWNSIKEYRKHKMANVNTAPVVSTKEGES